MTKSTGHDTLAIVFGARTQLGQTLLRILSNAIHDTVVIARDLDDAAWLASNWPIARIVRADDAARHWPQGYRSIVVYGCAVGLIHPQRPDWAKDLAAANRDIDLHREILMTYAGTPTHVLLVSSVLALSPRGTAYYGGWKNVVEGALQSLVSETAGARLSVLYPGRLIERRQMDRPLTLLSSSFAQITSEIVRVALGPVATRRVLGIDAYLWLLLRGLPSWLFLLNRKK